MEPQAAVDLFRECAWLALLISAPILLAGMAVGLAIGLLQAITQIQEQSLAFVPKVAVMVLVFLLTLPWVLIQLTEYSQELIRHIPEMF
ncbi:MAG: flagellar biosynthesis protein FliQ [Thermogutta sp.]|nr:flagellar biosynthesis protein FliQ [Thermogutta sp.]HPU05444.1 flagellar biosynthesis protein FliQ [Thermogutta sp.]HPZ82025.1 flagellar biosynthesis protein FliQ [Thermogutta sp.]HQF12290.1 flagellar biosynthesis protein FliQ [Thermogutta sp.]